jgi:glycosyltransferase involved in cell wall biosynthesis
MVNELEKKLSVSFVLPAYNEGECILGALERLESAAKNNGLGYEVVVVDDGSADDTRLKAWRHAARNRHVRIIGHDRNIGKGVAMRTGFRYASGDVVVLVDSDSDIDYEQVKYYVEALRFGGIVIGSKWHKDSIIEVPVVRRFLSHAFNILVKLLTGVKVSDTQTGIKAVRRGEFKELFERLCVKRFAFDVELLVLARICGLRVVELPVKLKIDKRFSLREAWRMFYDLLGITYRLRVKKWYQPRSCEFEDSDF